MSSKRNFYCGSCLLLFVGICLIIFILVPQGIVALIERYDTRQETKRVDYIEKHQPPANIPSLSQVLEISDVNKTIGDCLEDVRLNNQETLSLSISALPETTLETIGYNFQEFKKALRELRIDNHTYDGIFTSSKQIFELVNQYNYNDTVYTCLANHRDELNALFSTHQIIMAQRPPNSCLYDLENPATPSTITRSKDIDALYISIAKSQHCPSLVPTFGLSTRTQNPIKKLFAIPKFDYDTIFFENYEVLPY